MLNGYLLNGSTYYYEYFSYSFDNVAIPSSSQLQDREYPFISVSGCRSVCSGATLSPAWSPRIPSTTAFYSAPLCPREGARSHCSTKCPGARHGWEHANTVTRVWGLGLNLGVYSQHSLPSPLPPLPSPCISVSRREPECTKSSNSADFVKVPCSPANSRPTLGTVS